MEFDLNGKRCRAEYNLGAVFFYEEVTGHEFTGRGVGAWYMLMYQSVRMCTEAFELSFVEFMRWLGGNMGVFEEFMRMWAEGQRASMPLEGVADDGGVKGGVKDGGGGEKKSRCTRRTRSV